MAARGARVTLLLASQACSFMTSLVFLLVLSPSTAHARKFDFKNESIAAYFRATSELSRAGDTGFASSSGDGVSFNSKAVSNLSGEFGLLFSASRFNLRLGGQVVGALGTSELKGKNADGVELFELESDLLAIIPQANLEIYPVVTATSRVLLGLGGGLAFVTLDNAYKLLPDGVTAYPGLVDHMESGANSVTMLQAYVGYEVLFTDVVTVVADLGYRYALVKSLKSTKETTTFSGTQVVGDELKNMDGGNRVVDLGGLFAGLAFRFYIGL